MVKRLVFKALFSVMAAGGIVTYLAALNGVDVGRPFRGMLDDVSLPDFDRVSLPELPRGAPTFHLPSGGDASGVDGADRQSTAAREAETSAKVVYRWRDSAGVWHFQQEKPRDTEAEAIQLEPDRNIVRSTDLISRAATIADARAKANEKFANDEKEKASATVDESANQGGPAHPYSPTAVRKLIEDARNIQSTMDERTRELEKY